MKVSNMNKCISKTKLSYLINTNFEDHAKLEKTLLGSNYTSFKNQVVPNLGRRKFEFITQATRL